MDKHLNEKQHIPQLTQESLLSPRLFLMYINDLSDGIISMCKISAEFNIRV